METPSWDGDAPQDHSSLSETDLPKVTGIGNINLYLKIASFLTALI